MSQVPIIKNSEETPPQPLGPIIPMSPPVGGAAHTGTELRSKKLSVAEALAMQRQRCQAFADENGITYEEAEKEMKRQKMEKDAAKKLQRDIEAIKKRGRDSELIRAAARKGMSDKMGTSGGEVGAQKSPESLEEKKYTAQQASVEQAMTKMALEEKARAKEALREQEIKEKAAEGKARALKVFQEMQMSKKSAQEKELAQKGSEENKANETVMLRSSDEKHFSTKKDSPSEAVRPILGTHAAGTNEMASMTRNNQPAPEKEQKGTDETPVSKPRRDQNGRFTKNGGSGESKALGDGIAGTTKIPDEGNPRSPSLLSTACTVKLPLDQPRIELEDWVPGAPKLAVDVWDAARDGGDVDAMLRDLPVAAHDVLLAIGQSVYDKALAKAQAALEECEEALAKRTAKKPAPVVAPTVADEGPMMRSDPEVR